MKGKELSRWILPHLISFLDAVYADEVMQNSFVNPPIPLIYMQNEIKKSNFMDPGYGYQLDQTFYEWENIWKNVHSNFIQLTRYFFFGQKHILAHFIHSRDNFCLSSFFDSTILLKFSWFLFHKIDGDFIIIS